MCCCPGNLYIVVSVDCWGDPAQILGIEMGEALKQRKVGGRVADAVGNEIPYPAVRAGAGRLPAW